MKQVALTIGPQGAGKSMFCARCIKVYPDVVLVGRDKILIELFGDAYLEEGSAHFIGEQHMWEVVAGHLPELGVTRLQGWYFITPLETCRQWFLGEFVLRENRNEEKQMIFQKMRALSYNRCYQNFHAQPVDLT